MPLLAYSDEIRGAVLMIHGEKAHSRYFSEDAFKKLKGDNKELLIIPGASHVDLYDNQANGIWIAIASMWVLAVLMEYVICRVAWKKVLANY